MSQVTKSEISLKKKIWTAFKETMEGSSIHSFPNMTRSEFISVKVIWLICFLVSGAICIWFIVLNINDYLSRDVVTKIQVIPVDSIGKQLSNRNISKFSFKAEYNRVHLIHSSR
jgi:hypothetical protein